MNIIVSTFLAVTTHSFKYILFCLILFIIVTVISTIFRRKPREIPTTFEEDVSEIVSKGELIKSELKKVNSIQDLFVTDLQKIPDETFQLNSDVNHDKKFYVNASKMLDFVEANMFDQIDVNVFNDGSLEVIFTSSFYNLSKYKPVINFLSALYELFGKDDAGQISISYYVSKTLRTNRLFLDNSFSWKNKNACFVVGKKITFSFYYESPNKDAILSSFYRPLVIVTENGILSAREAKLSNTEASLIKDEFTKRTSILITKVAGVQNERYVYTYTLTNDPTQWISTLTEIGISFSYSNGYFFLHLISSDKEYQLAKDDNIIFLFDDDTTISSVFSTPKAVDSDRTFRNVAHLSHENMVFFATKRVKKWKMTSVRKSRHVIGGPSDNYSITQYKGESEGQFLLQITAKKLLQCVLLYEAESSGRNKID